MPTYDLGLSRTSGPRVVFAAALHSGGEVERELGRRLRRWFLMLPAGVGLATVRACLKLIVGLKPSGVPSAGNGAAMLAAAVGAFYADDPQARERVVWIVARVTRTDVRGVDSARLVARAAASFRSDPSKAVARRSLLTRVPQRWLPFGELHALGMEGQRSRDADLHAKDDS